MVVLPVCEVSTYFTVVAYVESVQLVQPVRNGLLRDNTGTSLIVRNQETC